MGITRKPNETISQFAIRRAWETGHFWSPDNPDGRNVHQEDLNKLHPHDDVVVKAMISLSKMDAASYTQQVLLHHNRMPHFDGIIGPAMIDLVKSERCPVPDHAPPPGVVFAFDDSDLQQVVERMQETATWIKSEAIGGGNWPSCHGIGNFHCATVGIDDSRLPSFLQPVWLQVLKNVRVAYAGVGLLWKFIKSGKDVLTGENFSGVINTQLSFVNSSDGWIGLAIVGQNETCSSQIWCKFLATYRGGSDHAAVTTQWTTLLKHELGHNCGRGHTSGGVMNPSIVNNLPTEWATNDPSTSWLKQQFGGVPVPIPGGDPPKPPAPDDVESRLRAQEVKNVVQDVTMNWCVEQIRILKEKVG